MAKRRRARSRKTTTSIIRVPSAPRTASPIIRVSAPAARAPKKRRRSGGGSKKGSGFTSNAMMGAALGGAALGFLEKSFPDMPTIPILGKAGTIALIAYFVRGKVPLAREVGMVAAGLAGYQLGRDGRVSGDDHTYVVPQVRGIASQV